MARTAPAKKPSRSMIALLCAMIDNNAVASTSGSVGGGGVMLVGPSRVGMDKRHSSSIFHSAFTAGYVKRLPKDTPTKWAWYETRYEITDEGRAVAEANRTMLALPPPEERELVITVVPRGYRGRRQDTPPIGMLCEVIRRTEKRLYVNVLVNPHNFYSSLVQGREPDRYMDASDVAFWNVTRQQYDRLLEAAQDIHGWRTRIATEEEAAIAAARKPFQERRAQKDAQFADELREILGDKAPPTNPLTSVQ